MALLSDFPEITGNGDFDYIIQSPLTDIIIVGDTDGAKNGFDGASINMVSVHPIEQTDAVPIDMEAPVVNGQNITSDFTDVYEGQVKRVLRFVVSGTGANTAIRIHTGPLPSG